MYDFMFLVFGLAVTIALIFFELVILLGIFTLDLKVTLLGVASASICIVSLYILTLCKKVLTNDR